MLTKTDIYLADDHAIVAQGIANLLLSIEGIGSVKTFHSGKELFKACLAKLPRLVILDMEMPDWNGLVTLEKLKEKFSVPVIMLTMNDEKSVIEESIRKGAGGYVHKDCTIDELRQAIETVMQGNIFLSEETKKIMVGLRKQTPESVAVLNEPLTEREYEVLKLLCDGLTSKEIGTRLFLSSRTVESHKKNLMEKFNVHSTGKLITLAIKNKLVK